MTDSSRCPGPATSLWDRALHRLRAHHRSRRHRPAGPTPVGPPALTTLASFYQIGSMGPLDMNIKGLDDAVGRRLREQAGAAGLSVQQHLRNELARIATRPSPAEFAKGLEPMSRADFDAIRRRLRGIDAA